MKPKEIGRNLLSYISGTVVERRYSKISGELEVWYQSGKYVLHSPDANYSFDTLHRVFQKAFKNLAVKKRNPKCVLILGFGAGSVATILTEELNLNPAITGVELDPDVIELAHKYFQLDRFTDLKLIQEDAAVFAAQCQDSFDLLVSDVFIDKKIPEKFLTSEYISNLIRLTSKNGMGMMNMIAETTMQQHQLREICKTVEKSGVTCSSIRVSAINTMVCWTR